MLPTSVNGRRQRRYWDAKRPESVINADVTIIAMRMLRSDYYTRMRTKDVSIVIPPRVLHFSVFINPRRACAARVTVVVLCVCVCVCVFVCPGRSSATHVTKRQTRYTHGFSILLAPE